jgi:hypothetical protein
VTEQEHHNGQVHSSLDINGAITSFDDLAKGMASGTVSRRTALRWMGGALVGAALAAVPGAAWAQAPTPAGNSACARFCHQIFPPGGPEAGQCTSQGAQGGGPCYSCTPGIGPGPHFTPQCGPNEEFDPETCECVSGCPPGTTLCGNTCVDLSTDRHNCGACSNECDVRNICQNGECVCGRELVPVCGPGGVRGPQCCSPAAFCVANLCHCPTNVVFCDPDRNFACCSPEEVCNPAPTGPLCLPAA